MPLGKLQANSGPGLMRAPTFIFLLALATRLAVAVALPAQIVWPDGARYEAVALSLLHGHGFGSLSLNSGSVPTQPLLIAGVYAVFGQSYLALRIVSAVIGACSCLVGYFLTRRLFGEPSARVAGVMLGLYPYLVYLSALFEYPQITFILVMGLFFLFLQRFREAQRTVDVLAAGALLGVAILSVPTTLLYAPLAAIFVWLSARSARWWRAGVLIVALAVPVSSWAIRNYVAYHHVVLVNAAGGINFWFANNDTYDQLGKAAINDHCYPATEPSKFCIEWLAIERQMVGSNLTETERYLAEDRIYWRQGLKFVQESPRRFLLLSMRRFLHFWSPIPDAVTVSTGSAVSIRNALAAVTYVPALLLGLVGVILTRSQWRQLLPVYGFFLVISAAYSVFPPWTRYRLPLDFYLLIFAAVAIERLWLLVRVRGLSFAPQAAADR
jgi:4-amino-4-deoxy-L-arabinose transferase-like glycosyltransferase